MLVLTQWTRTAYAALVTVLIATAAPAADAQDTDNARTARDCVQAVRAVALNTGSDIRDLAGATTDEIAMLDADGASHQAIIGAGVRGRARIAHRAENGADRINQLVEHCVRTLRANDAAPALIAFVIDAGRDARREIARTKDRAERRIERAVRAALAD